MKQALLSLPLLAITAQTAGAQVVATSFEELQPLVGRGDTIQIIDSTGHKSKGRLGELSASSLELLVPKAGADGRDTLVPRALSERDVTQITVERFDSLWNGTLIGLAVVGGPWAVICSRGCYYNDGANLIRFIALVTTAIGTGVGTLIDLAIRDRTVVYYRAPNRRSPAARIGPLLSTSGAGLQVSLRF